MNALGTMYVYQEFSARMKKGSVILDVSLMAAYRIIFQTQIRWPEVIGESSDKTKKENILS